MSSMNVFSQIRSLAELPWDDLSLQLSSSAMLLDGSPEKYVSECVDTMNLESYPSDVSNHDLIDKPSGLCMNFLVNGYEQCTPLDTNTPDEWLAYNDFNLSADGGFDFSPPPVETAQILRDPTNPRFNLPYKVLKPINAGDIVSAVTFASKHGVEISVKNSGHHYAGASTKKDSLLIHTRSLPKYSLTSLEDCASLQDDTDIGDDLSNQACKLALARNVPATLRVGGGENWGEVYVNVNDANVRIRDNENGDGTFKYHAVGGAAATVSPMGWTWQGGLGGTTMGREFGFGVDQVLQIEMVLPNGSHVKFGPTEWEENVDGYKYPKTTKVSGVCNSNPFALDESEWVWETCDEANDINFDDLWFATRGGGGGTWGVVVSTHIQLHEYPGLLRPLYFLLLNPLGIEFVKTTCIDTLGFTKENCNYYVDTLASVQARFFLDIMVDPSSVSNFTEQAGRMCGKAGGNSFVECYGDSANAVVTAWKIRVNEKLSHLVNDKGIPNDFVEAVKDFVLSVYSSSDAYVDFIIYPEGHRLAGLGADNPPPLWNSYIAKIIDPIIPKQVILDNMDFFVSQAKDYRFMYFAHVDDTDDQASSLSQPHREGAYMAQLTSIDDYKAILELMFDGMDYDGDFPGLLGSNHLSPTAMGPVKSNWTMACPNDWTWEKRAEECFSPQEAVYGTQRLQRLEEIKANVDPNNMFNCNTCIGGPDGPDDETAGPTGAPTGAPTDSNDGPDDETAGPTGAPTGAPTDSNDTSAGNAPASLVVAALSGTVLTLLSHL